MRAIKHFLEGQRKTVDESVNYETARALVENSGAERIEKNVRLASGFRNRQTTGIDAALWFMDSHLATEKGTAPYKYDLVFSGTHTVYAGNAVEVHYLDMVQSDRATGKPVRSGFYKFEKK